MNWKNNFRKYKNIFFEIISFSTSRSRLFLFSFSFSLFSIIPTGAISKLPIKCIYHDFLLPLVFNGNCPSTGIFAGCHCPTCGMTRAFSRLFHGDITGALEYNSFVLIVLSMIILIMLLDLSKILKNNRK